VDEGADKRNNHWLFYLFVIYLFIFDTGKNSLSPATVENAALGYFVLSLVLTNLIVSFGPNDSTYTVSTNYHPTSFVAMRATKEIEDVCMKAI